MSYVRSLGETTSEGPPPEQEDMAKHGEPSFAEMVYNHPFSFAFGVGAANGLLAVSRNKKIDLQVTATLAMILGLGEMAIEYFVPEQERHHKLPAIGLYSVAGVALGLVPFIWWTRAKQERAHGLLVATRNGEEDEAAPTAGW